MCGCESAFSELSKTQLKCFQRASFLSKAGFILLRLGFEHRHEASLVTAVVYARAVLPLYYWQAQQVYRSLRDRMSCDWSAWAACVF